MNHIEMDIDDDFEFFCPMTGRIILGPEVFEPSAAMAFYFIPEAPDFQLLNEAYASILKPLLNEDAQDAEDEYSVDHEVFDRFAQAILAEHPNLVLFSFTSHGIACGPVSSTVHICIDFAYRCDSPD